MKPRVQVKFWLALLPVALSLGAITFATTGVLRGNANHTPGSAQNSQLSTTSSRNAYVRRSVLSPRLTQNLSALGNRLEKPGKERLTLTGTWRAGASVEAREFAAILEFPDRLRLVVQNGAQSRVITFDGEQTRVGQVAASADEFDLIESLAYDSAEHFFATQMQGNAMRFLGARFRTDDGSTANYDGPYFDIYKIADQIEASGAERAAKLYHFNSDTLLLERVTYVTNRNGSEIRVETKLSDWSESAGQRLARRIERLENGTSVFVLAIRSTELSSRADDGLFAQ